MTRQGALRVLVVEDEFLIALTMERMLHRFGVEVVGPIASLAEAVEIACTAELDGAVLDVNVDGEKIYPCAEQLGDRGIPFILTTGYAAANLPERYRTATWQALLRGGAPIGFGEDLQTKGSQLGGAVTPLQSGKARPHQRRPRSGSHASWHRTPVARCSSKTAWLGRKP
jgi:CheY-like chemotaxis protein